MNDFDSILARLLELFRNKFGPNAQPDAHFATLDVDSLALAEISLLVEKEFQVRLTERVLEVNSIRELAQLVTELRLSPAVR